MVYVLAMCFVEIKYLSAKRKIKVTLLEVEQTLLNAANVSVHPLDEYIVSVFPIGLNIHDAIITATALVHRDLYRSPATLITKDTEIRKSGLIPTLW